MATRKASSKSAGQLVKWDEELARQAEVAAAMEASTGTGSFFSLKGGILTWQDMPLKDNQMGVIILDAVLENVYYDDDYDPDNPRPPMCFAFAHDEKIMGPHETVVEAGQSQTDESGLCSACQWNQWGSADKGRGKACRNTRRLALVSAGGFSKGGDFELIDDPQHYQQTPIGFLKLPLTSVKGYAGFVKQVANVLKRPPHGVVSKVSVHPDPKNQFVVTVEPLDKVPDRLMGVIMQRRTEALGLIEQPYDLTLNAEPEPSRRGRAPAKKKSAATRKGRKY